MLGDVLSAEEVTADYNHLRLSLKAHPLVVIAAAPHSAQRVLRERDLAALKGRATREARAAWCWCGSSRAPPKA